MTIVQIRMASPLDAGRITEIVRAAYSKWMPVIGREPLPMQVDYADALGKHHFDVAVLDLSVVGLIETELRADHVWIENIAIAPEAQGRGIGQKLMAHVEAKALAAGLSDVRLLTNGAFDANLRFYHQQGFQTDRVESFKGGVAVYMSKNLTP